MWMVIVRQEMGNRLGKQLSEKVFSHTEDPVHHAMDMSEESCAGG